MIMIEPMSPPTSDITAASPGMTSLQDRVRAQHALLGLPPADVEGDDGEPPVDAMASLVRAWAVQMLKEEMLFGDEEKTGVTPVIIDF